MFEFVFSNIFKIKDTRILLFIILSSVGVLLINSCASNTNINTTTSTNSINSKYLNSKILVVKKKKNIDQYARFNYYTNNTLLLVNLKQELEKLGYQNINISPETVFLVANTDDARALASRYNADKVLIINDYYSIEGHPNILALTYLSIIGMFIFPGNSLTTKCEIEASLINVSDGQELFVNSTSSESHTYIYRIGNSDSIIYSSIQESMNKSLKSFITSFIKAGGV